MDNRSHVRAGNADAERERTNKTTATEKTFAISAKKRAKTNETTASENQHRTQPKTLKLMEPPLLRNAGVTPRGGDFSFGRVRGCFCCGGFVCCVGVGFRRFLFCSASSVAGKPAAGQVAVFSIGWATRRGASRRRPTSSLGFKTLFNENEQV